MREAVKLHKHKEYSMPGKNIFMVLIFNILILILINSCRNNEKFVQFEKERILYQQKVQSAVDRLDMKIVQLHAMVEKDRIDRRNLEPYITDMEGLEENLNRKLGELDNVTVDEWKETKQQINNLLAEMNDSLEKVAEILNTSVQNKDI
jgi:hypothetical protein